jgi:hypothetical protein
MNFIRTTSRFAMITAPRAILFTFFLIVALPLTAATSAPFNYPAAIAEARRTWSADARELAELLRKLAEAARKAGQTEDKLTEARRAVASLKRELEVALEEVRAGLFCDGCGRTRSDLLSHGESFPHPGQHSRPARPEDYERVEKDFANRMDLQQQVIARLEPELTDAKSDLMALHHRFLVLLPAYHRHLADESEQRLGKWLDEKTTAETELKAIHAAIAALKDKIRAMNDVGQVKQGEAELKRLEQQLAQRVTDSKFAGSRAQQEERNLRKDVLASLDSLGRIAEPIPNRFGIDGWFISKSIRNPPKPVGYTVNAIYVGSPNATVSELQDLLNGTPAPNPTPNPNAKSPKEKSVQDLLDGK